MVFKPRFIESGTKFGRLTTTDQEKIEILNSGRKKFLILCICSCGQSKWISKSNLITRVRPTLSCGCLRNEYYLNDKKRSDQIIGKTFNQLTVLYRNKPDNYGHAKYTCRCICGQESSIDKQCIITGHTKSCGNCKNYINGRQISGIQVQLANLIPNSVINYIAGKFSIDIALLSDRIAIEYDEWYWHGDKLIKDNEKDKYLIDNGWKILRIKASNNIPNTELLNLSIQALKSGVDNYREIVLPGWRKGKIFIRRKLNA